MKTALRLLLIIHCLIIHTAVYGAWTMWVKTYASSCSEMCTQDELLERMCLSTVDEPTCKGPKTKIRVVNCSNCNFANGQWSTWRDDFIGDCSVTCGYRKGYRRMKQIRVCDNPPPRAGGMLCAGDAIKQFTSDCFPDNPCPNFTISGVWGSWENSTLRMCSTTCGVKPGIKFIVQTRSCSSSDAVSTNDTCAFQTAMRTITDSCFSVNRCPDPGESVKVVDGRWSLWLDVSVCSVTCGDTEGIMWKSMKRFCSNPVPQGGGGFCVGDSEKNLTLPCRASIPCPGIEKKVSYWSTWSLQEKSYCSRQCRRKVLYSRSCLHPKKKCKGNSTKNFVEACKSEMCQAGEGEKKINFTMESEANTTKPNTTMSGNEENQFAISFLACIFFVFALMAVVFLCRFRNDDTLEVEDINLEQVSRKREANQKELMDRLESHSLNKDHSDLNIEDT